ncbi:MAG: HAMP domain-containing histidine kinase [Acidobacteriota bacterium]|nr:MAG: HAMP domain-containing histidine kinase [Acidobacteriota bacterium]
MMDENNEERYLLEAGRLVSRLMHDFKNQLGGLKLYIAYLKKRFADQPEIIEVVEKVSQSINALVDQSMLVSALTRPLKLSLEPADLRAIAQLAIEDHKRAAGERGLELELRSGGGPAALVCDAQQMRAAIGGMIARAIESAPPASTVSLTIDQRDGVSRIEVSDGGEAPAGERLRGMFDMVGPERMTRTSLGLAMARRIVETHGGSITAAPASTGTVLTIEIPGSPADTVP